MKNVNLKKKKKKVKGSWEIPSPLNIKTNKIK